MTHTHQEGKAVVVSGGAGYLGTRIVGSLIVRGFTPIVIGRNPKNSISQAALFFPVDISDPEGVEAVTRELQKRFGNISGIVHAASSPLIRRPVLSQSIHDFQSQFSVNVIGAFNIFKHLVPLIVPGGAIVGITTISAQISAPSPRSGSYLSAKYALRGLLKTLSMELHAQMIRVYAVAPAFMPGGLNRDMPVAAVELLKKKSELHHVADPESVANIVSELVSGETEFVAGVSIAVPGLSTTNL